MSPLYKLHVVDGSIAIYNTADDEFWRLSYNSSSNDFVISEDGAARIVMANGSFVGIGSASPNYKLQLSDGTFALYNSTDQKYWTMGYSRSYNYFSLRGSGVARIVVENGGNVGIGTTTPTLKLDVVGNVRVDGNLTVSDGKGIVRSWNSAQQKYYTLAAAFTAVIPAFSNSAEATIAWPFGILPNHPRYW